jgi:hypothetical protein
MFMRSCQFLLIAILFFIGAWICLLCAGVYVPPNPTDLSDTDGLSAIILYTVALQGIGLVAILFVVAGILVSLGVKSKPYNVRLMVFILSNSIFVLSSFLGISIILSNVFGTLCGGFGLVLYLSAIGLTLAAAPRRP